MPLLLLGQSELLGWVMWAHPGFIIGFITHSASSQEAWQRGFARPLVFLLISVSSNSGWEGAEGTVQNVEVNVIYSLPFMCDAQTLALSWNIVFFRYILSYFLKTDKRPQTKYLILFHIRSCCYHYYQIYLKPYFCVSFFIIVQESCLRENQFKINFQQGSWNNKALIKLIFTLIST